MVRAEGGGRLLARGRGGRRYLSVCRRARASASSRHSSRCASSCPSATAPQCRARRFRRAGGSGVGDYVGGFVVTAGIEEEAIAERFAERQRRLFLDPRQGARRPLRRSLRRGDAARVQARTLGLCARRDAAPEELHRGELSRHPPGARLSRPARPYGKGDAVRAARRRGADRREADGELRDVAGLVASQASISPTRKRIISASPRSSATRSRTMPRARAWRSARSSAGSRRCSTTRRWLRRRSSDRPSRNPAPAAKVAKRDVAVWAVSE